MIVRSAKSVNGLVVVADHTQIFVRIGQQSHQSVLSEIGILVLVDEQMLPPIAVFFQHVGFFLKQFHRFLQEIIEIQSVVFHQPFLVLGKYRSNRFCKPGLLTRLCVLLRGEELIFCARDVGGDGFVFDLLLVVPPIFQNHFHEPFGIIGVEDHKISRQACFQFFNIFSENPNTGGVKGPHVWLGRLPEEKFNPRFHLVGGFIGKRHGENLFCRSARCDQVRDAVGERFGFSTARASQD
ncbi:MAG: hypothetical protein K9M51_02095 [Candidatus Gracilibacteria bacterium]|nr:hypothetical protein [Candidatus Gracilibacteria bacterium]